MNIPRKKSQIKFGETFGIIIIVYIVIVLGMIWYNKVNTNDIYEMKEKDALNKAFEKNNYMKNSQFLHLSQEGDVDEEFNLASLEVFYAYSQESAHGKEFVREQLGKATIIVKTFDKSVTSQAFTGAYRTILIYNNTPNEKYKVSDGERVRYVQNTYRTLIPVVDETEDVTKLGLMEVTVYD